MTKIRLEELIGFELKRAQQESAQLFANSMMGTLLKPGQYSLLRTIASYPDETIKSVAKRLALEPSNLSGLLDCLEGEGYLQRARLSVDKRARVLRLTPLGRKILKRCERMIATYEETLTRGMSPAEKSHLLGSLGKLIRNCAANSAR
jgi:DNA-binding MarR family transcriptional regulator